MDTCIRAIRGATTVSEDARDELLEATRELLEEMMSRNGVSRDDLVSLVFTSTPDLTSEFPALAARRMDISDVPLLCAAEIAVEGALPRCIRILMHLNTSRGRGELRHVYLRDARSLRSDLADS